MPLFVPATDELVYDHPERITAPLVPFSLDYDCYRWMAAGEPAIRWEEQDEQTPLEE